MMQELSAVELGALTGGDWGDFLSGLSCGVGLVAAGAAIISPDPFSKVALVTYGGTLAGCVSYFL